MEADDEDEEDIVETVTLLDEAQKKVVDLQPLIKRKRKALGIDGRVSLQRLSGSQFLQLRMSARALKTRIRDRLRQRKFELSSLERAYRHCSNGKLYSELSIHT